MTGLLTMAATALLVFSRAIQQLNVTGGHYVAAAMTPMLIAAGEIAVVGAIVVGGWSSWPWISAGGGIGAVLAMVMHARIKRAFQRSESNEKSGLQRHERNGVHRAGRSDCEAAKGWEQARVRIRE